jgi:hypothetical protein
VGGRSSRRANSHVPLPVHSPVDAMLSWRGGQVAHVPASEHVAHETGQVEHLPLLRV